MRLAGGVALIPDADRKRHAEFFAAHQSEDGGFSGRDVRSDLYYTAFALRGLVLLGELDDSVAHRAAEFLRQQLRGDASLIDLISLVFGARLLESSAGIELLEEFPPQWTQKLADTFENLRREDGGYAKTFEGRASSTYQTFLIALTYQLMGLPLPEPERACQFVLDQHREDGGFVEIRVMRRSGNNPTAAAIGTLRVLGQHHIDASLRDAVADFLLDSVTDEGGLRANTQIPIADLLSTFTGLQTATDLGVIDAFDVANCLLYAASLQEKSGGFRAAAWDDVADVEYSFYGLGVLGLLLSA